MSRPPWDGWRVVADYHTHTIHSHGRGTVLQNARVAAARGLETIAISEHGPEAVPWVAVDSKRTYEHIRREAHRATRETGVRVLTACECNVMSLDGELDLAPRDLARLDLAAAGLHLELWPDTLGRLREAARLVLPNVPPWKWSARVRARARVDNTKALVATVRRHRLAFVTHPGLHLPVDTPELARACAARGTRMEISSAHHETDVAYVRAAAKEGVDFVLSSDAHRPERVGDLGLALSVARRARLEPERVWNVARVRKTRADRRRDTELEAVLRTAARRTGLDLTPPPLEPSPRH